MQKISVSTFLLLIAYVGFSQNTTMLRGRVVTSNATTATINIINLTQKLGTINDKHGKFKINATLGDTVIFSSVQYKQETLMVTPDNLEKTTLEIILELEVNQLDEVIVSKNTLTGNIEQDAKNIETYQDHLPLFNAKALDLTPFIHEKGITTVKNIITTDEMDATPINIIAVGRMIYSAFKKKDHKKPVTALKVSTYYSDLFLTEELGIPETELYNFHDYLHKYSGIKYILQTGNELKILEFLIQQRDKYISKQNTKN